MGSSDSSVSSRPKGKKRDPVARILWLELELRRFEQMAREHGLHGMAEQMRMALGTPWAERE